jgi:tetratricopeptide (TPR) repeat protein
MLRVAISIALALLAGGAAAGTAADGFERSVAEAEKLSDADHCDKALPMIRKVLAGPDLAAASDQQAMRAWSVAAWCASDRNDNEEAYADSIKATAFDNAPERAWLIRLWYALQLGKRDNAVATAELLASVDPAVVREIDWLLILQFERQLIADGAQDLNRRYLAALDRADYQPSGPFQGVDSLWLKYAGMLADDGSTDALARVLGKIHAPGAILRIRLDGRFAAQVAADPDHFDPRRVTELWLAQDQATLRDHPDLAQGVSAAAEVLRMLGRAKEALDLIDAAQAKIAAAPANKPAFSDLDSQGNWLIDERSRVLSDLGRFDEQIESLRKGAAMKENGQLNVSQVINLAEALNDDARPREALDVLAPFGADGEKRPTSPFGAMQMMSARACAYAQLGRAADLAAALAYLRTHEKDAPLALSDGLLCANDLDGAAASYVRNLSDPEQRSDVLMTLSEFADRPPDPPWAKAIHARRTTVATRPDVRAAIAKVGRVETFPLAFDPQ